PANDLDVLDGAERAADLLHTPGTENERVPASQDDFPDFGMRADVSERRVEFLARKVRFRRRSNHLAAEAEAAIDRAHADDLEQRAVRIAVYDTAHRTFDVIPDRIGALLRRRLEFPHVRHEL